MMRAIVRVLMLGTLCLGLLLAVACMALTFRRRDNRNAQPTPRWGRR